MVNHWYTVGNVRKDAHLMARVQNQNNGTANSSSMLQRPQTRKKRSRARRSRAPALPHASKPLLATNKPWFVYCLVHASGVAPYVGSTFDLDRRLRQHNTELVGGARRTTAHVRKTGVPWTRALHVRNFIDRRSCLSFEKAVQRACRGLSGGTWRTKPVERCVAAIEAVLARPAPSRIAIPFAAYPVPLEIVRENEYESKSESKSKSESHGQ